MLRAVLGLLLALHGAIHLIGFVVPWRITEIRGFAYSTSVFWGRAEVGDVGARALGAGWLLAAFAFVAAGVGVAFALPWAAALVAIAAGMSTILCIAGSPAAIAGVVIDAVILMALAVTQLLGTMGGN